MLLLLIGYEIGYTQFVQRAHMVHLRVLCEVFLFSLQATELTHPSGCAITVAVGGKGLGWFGTLLLMYVLFVWQLNK